MRLASAWRMPSSERLRGDRAGSNIQFMSRDSSAEIARIRLLNHHITRRPLEAPVDLVRHLGAVQAQDYLGALWALGLRLRSATESSVEQALAERMIVRTWPMRGTLHLVAADDARWMLSLLAPRVLRSAAARHRQLGLDDGVFTRAERILTRALEGGKQLTRPAMYRLLEADGIATSDSRGLHILGFLAHRQVLVLGTREGRQHTFRLFEEWVPPTSARTREESLAELAIRYFSSHGPATIQDFAWWSGLTIAEVKEAIALAGSRVISETFDGQTCWLGENAAVSDERKHRVHLLPPFDEYTVAYRNRDAVVDPAHARRVNAGGGMLNAVIVIDGRVVGTWKRTLKKGEVLLTLEPFGRLKRDERQAIDAVADRYGAFLGMPARVT